MASATSTSEPTATATAGSTLRVPDKVELVREAIARLATQKSRAQIVGLDDDVVEALCLMLVDRAADDTQATAMLEARLGKAEDGGSAPTYWQVNRFGNRFRPLYAQVRREHCARIARLTVGEHLSGDTRQLTEAGVHHLTRLITERLVEADSLDDLTNKDINAAIASLDAVSRGQIKAAELELKRAEAEGKAQRLEADLRKREAEIEKLKADAQARLADERAKKARQRERIDALAARLDAAEGARAAGRAVDADVFAAMRRELVALAAESATATGGDA